MKEIVLNEVTVMNQTVMPTRPAKLSTPLIVEAPTDPLEALAELELVLEPKEYLDLLSRQRSEEKR